MERNITQTSIVVAIAKWLLNTCKESQIYKKYNIFSKAIMATFRHSFLGKISEIKEGDDSRAIIDNSEFIRRSLSTYKTCKSRLTNTQTSIVVDSVKEIAGKLYSSPIKIISIIAVIAILINMPLFILLPTKNIGLLGWIIRILLLFLALAGLFCDAHWQEIKQASFLLRYTNKYCKKGN